jgi:hypothetical protein
VHKNVILKTQSLAFKATVLLLISGLVALAIRVIVSAFHGASPYGSVILVLGLLVAAVGLWRLKDWARALVVIFIWLLLIVGVPLGGINPFAAMDELGPNPPSAWQLAASIFPRVALGIFVLYILGKHRREFSRRAVTQQGAKADGPASGGSAA